MDSEGGKLLNEKDYEGPSWCISFQNQNFRLRRCKNIFLIPLVYLSFVEIETEETKCEIPDGPKNFPLDRAFDHWRYSMGKVRKTSRWL